VASGRQEVAVFCKGKVGDRRKESWGAVLCGAGDRPSRGSSGGGRPPGRGSLAERFERRRGFANPDRLGGTGHPFPFCRRTVFAVAGRTNSAKTGKTGMARPRRGRRGFTTLGAGGARLAGGASDIGRGRGSKRGTGGPQQASCSPCRGMRGPGDRLELTSRDARSFAAGKPRAQRACLFFPPTSAFASTGPQAGPSARDS